MSPNHFGECFRIISFGESHGEALGVVIDGVRPGLEIGLEEIQRELDRRRPGQSALVSARAEPDRVELLSGVFEGRSTGAPIALLVRNRDARPEAYEPLRELFRPGHADFSWLAKYGIRDWRGGGRSSGRETVARVAAGAVARALLRAHGVRILGHVSAVGEVCAKTFDAEELEKNPMRCADPEAAQAMARRVEQARAEGDSVGCLLELVAEGVPAGWGDPVFLKLDATLAAAMMSIGGVKGVELGSGFALCRMTGSQANDPILPPLEPHSNGSGVAPAARFGSNHAGGILGGISTGAAIVLRLAVKPTPSVARAQQSIDLQGRPQRIEIKGRHDPCLGPRLLPVAEAMMAVVLADACIAQAALRAEPESQAQRECELARCKAELARLRARRRALEAAASNDASSSPSSEPAAPSST